MNLRPRPTLLALTLWTIAGTLQPGFARASSAPTEKSASVEEIVEGVEVTLKLNLGTIEVINVEPTHGRTSRMSFDLNLTFDPNTDPKRIRELDAWHHRLREQAIIAVRATEIYDFLDPELKRFRKQILYRINRILGEPIVNDALFANFTFFNE